MQSKERNAPKLSANTYVSFHYFYRMNIHITFYTKGNYLKHISSIYASDKETQQFS